MNNSTAPVVTDDLDVQVVLDDDERVNLNATLSYDGHDPYAVSATFHTADDAITWVFARDLIRDGMRDAVGEGDIRIRPAHPSRGALVLLTLSSPSGAARIEAQRPQLQEFVTRMYDAVPEGAEWRYLQVDRVIDELLTDEA